MPSVGETSVRSSSLRYGRIAAAAVLLELTLFVVLTPIGLVVGMPGAGNGTDFTVYFRIVPAACVVFPFLWGMWLARGVSSQHAMHGLWLGVVATVIYLAICSIPP